VREAIFNLLINGRAALEGGLAGVRVLDLFAGTGALGLEALSRGAAWASFVEDGAVAQGLLGRNIALMRAAASTTILRRDATRPGQNPGAPHGLVFLDPPYGKGMGEAAMAAVTAAGGWLAPGATIVWEEAAPPQVPQGFVMLDQRHYGDTVVTILRAPE
jgi:16S rRNA (guanine966-N2)-methyltransferase